MKVFQACLDIEYKQKVNGNLEDDCTEFVKDKYQRKSSSIYQKSFLERIFLPGLYELMLMMMIMLLINVVVMVVMTLIVLIEFECGCFALLHLLHKVEYLNICFALLHMVEYFPLTATRGSDYDEPLFKLARGSK